VIVPSSATGRSGRPEEMDSALAIVCLQERPFVWIPLALVPEPENTNRILSGSTWGGWIFPILPRARLATLIGEQNERPKWRKVEAGKGACKPDVTGRETGCGGKIGDVAALLGGSGIDTPARTIKM